jgi:hypothetical protein
MESLKTAFKNASSPFIQSDDLWFWIILLFIITDDIAQKKAKERRKKQQKRLKLSNQPKRPKAYGPSF